MLVLRCHQPPAATLLPMLLFQEGCDAVPPLAAHRQPVAFAVLDLPKVITWQLSHERLGRLVHLVVRVKSEQRGARAVRAPSGHKDW